MPVRGPAARRDGERVHLDPAIEVEADTGRDEISLLDLKEVARRAYRNAWLRRELAGDR